MPNCTECKFCVAVGGRGNLECHVDPPRANADKTGLAIWPVVHPLSWCGKFESEISFTRTETKVQNENLRHSR